MRDPSPARPGCWRFEYAVGPCRCETIAELREEAGHLHARALHLHSNGQRSCRVNNDLLNYRECVLIRMMITQE